MDLLKLLWPNFSLLLTGNTNGISAWFWLLTAGIFAIALLALVFHASHFRARLKALHSLLDGQTKEHLALNRRETLQRALGLKNASIGMLWREFDESLVSSGDQKLLFNTLDAEHFFNARTLAPGLTASRLLAATPGFLVAIGVLGTFVGLTIGLANLQIDSHADVEKLRGGIDMLIQGAAVAFMTSVWGVTFSLALNFIEKMFERSALAKIQGLQHTIDFLYPRILAEQSLVHIADHSRESSTALQELHERIGDRLQESIQGMNEAMQTALTDALNNIMGPAIQTLVNGASQQSSQVLDKLVGNFMDGMTSVGREQGNQMQQAAEQVNAAVTGMSSQLNQLFHSLSDQQGQQQASAQQQSREFEAQLQRVVSSGEQREQQLEQRFNQLMSGLGGQLDGQLSAAQRRDDERQTLLERSLAEASERQQGLLEQVANSTREQMQTMAEAGNERHNNLEKVFSRLMMNLNTQLDGQLSSSEQREQARAERHEQQQTAAAAQQQQLVSSLSQTTQQQLSAMVEATTAQQDNLQSAFGKLLGNLNEQMSGHSEHAEQREQSRQQRLAEQMESMASQQQLLLESIAKAVQTTQQQSLQMAEQHQQLLGRLQQTSEAAAVSSKHMDNSANQLGLLSTNVRQAAELLGQRLESVTARIEGAGAQNAELAEQLKGQSTSLSQLQEALLQSAQQFEKAASEARNGFGEMQSHQQEFLAGVRSEFTALGEALRTQVSGVEKQAEEWLRSYSSETRSQVEERMDQWNKQTLSFADQMYAAVQAISNVVDELEAK
jgi:hypothetical protein